MNENFDDEIVNLLCNIDEAARRYDVYKYGLPAGEMKLMKAVVRVFMREMLLDIEMYLVDKKAIDEGELQGWLEQYKIDRKL